MADLFFPQLISFFETCQGRLHKFTFIDPTENMLVNSVNLAAAPWQVSSPISITSGVSDPTGASAAFSLTNNGQAEAEINQTFAVPANYQYCFSVYAESVNDSTVTLIRQGDSSKQASSYSIGPRWQRLK